MKQKNQKELLRALKAMNADSWKAREQSRANDDFAGERFQMGMGAGIALAVKLIEQAEDAEAVRKPFVPEIGGVKL
jgi:hypothetical protein